METFFIFNLTRSAILDRENSHEKAWLEDILNNQIEDELAEGGEDEQILRQSFFVMFGRERVLGKNRAEVTKIFSESVTSAVTSSFRVQWCLVVWPSH